MTISITYKHIMKETQCLVYFPITCRQIMAVGSSGRGIFYSVTIRQIYCIQNHKSPLLFQHMSKTVGTLSGFSHCSGALPVSKIEPNQNKMSQKSSKKNVYFMYVNLISVTAWNILVNRSDFSMIFKYSFNI